MTNEMLADQIAEPRTCSNCACHIIQPHVGTGNETQMFCRRNTVMAQPARMERPRLNARTKEVEIDKRTGKPIMETFTDLVYLFQPTLANLTCFDGWRPIDTLPGDFDYKSADIEKRYAQALMKLANDLGDETRNPGVVLSG